MGEDVDGAAAESVEAGLVGDQADFHCAVAVDVKFAEAVFFEHVDAVFDGAVAGGEAARGHERLVVAGDALQA